MALSVGCRPTSIFISLLNVPLLIILLSSGSKTESFWIRIKNHRGDLLSALIPYGIVGAFLGYYNYARFGSLFEFGRTYQLSLVDARAYQNGLSIPSWLIGIVNFIFGSGANLISSFPFVKPVDTITFGFAGYKELNPVYSAVLLCPLILFIPFVLLVLRRRFKGKGAAFQVFFSCLIILSFLLAGFCGASAGTLQRYMLDFYWMIILAGLLSAFLIGEWLSEHHTYQILAFVLPLCFFLSLFMTAALWCGEPIIRTTTMSWFEVNNPMLYHKIDYLLALWK